ncbi:MAG TPA: methyltransferase domain-containing protein [Solirubrobacterales bacterium]|jgi:SAM-dependent methyltransferase
MSTADAAAYDELGRGYSVARRTDPRIAAHIEAALGEARTVLNVGAGTGSYESGRRELTAVEPSGVMIAQRPEGAAPVIQAGAEALPFEDDSFDAAMAIISDHHWRDREAGLAEMRRVARGRVLLLNADPAAAGRFWLTRDYLDNLDGLITSRYREEGFWRDELQSSLGEVELRPVPIPHDCIDGFYQAFWRRPGAYLDPRVRDGTSVFRMLSEARVDSAIRQLSRDLSDGTWKARYGDLLRQPELDVGLRLVVAGDSAA